MGSTISVNTPADETLPDDGTRSLREAVIAANANGTSGSAAGECAAGEGLASDRIELPAGTYTRTKGGAFDNNGATGDLDVGSGMTIHGAGATVTTIDAAQKDRVFDVLSSEPVQIEGVTITGGAAPSGVSQAGNQFPTGADGGDAID